MMLNMRIFLIWAVACAFLQVDHVDGVESCYFPFTFGGQKYFDCTRKSSVFLWCSLDEEYTGRWKYCTKDDYARCSFPFIYNGKEYDKCTSDGSPLRREWCSLSADYDKDGSWKACFPFLA